MALSLELVPRDEDSFTEQLQAVSLFKQHFTHLNIPDISRFKLRSWEACVISRSVIPKSIPHLRAIDFNKNDPSLLFSMIKKYQFDEVLVVKGDVPQDMSKAVYSTSAIDLIRVLKKEFPQLTVYAAFDPYRTGIQAEMKYAEEKTEAGCDGFFTQPFLTCGFWIFTPSY